MEKGKKIQIHNFIVDKKEVDGVSYIKVGTLGDDWSVCYKEGSMMFMVIDSLSDDGHDAFHTIITALYGACSVIDKQFTDGLYALLDAYFERNKKEAISDEEDAKILAEERKAYELKKMRGELG